MYLCYLCPLSQSSSRTPWGCSSWTSLNLTPQRREKLPLRADPAVHPSFHGRRLRSCESQLEAAWSIGLHHHLGLTKGGGTEAAGMFTQRERFTMHCTMHYTRLERQIADAIAESSLGSGLTSKALLARIKLIRFEWFGVYWTLSVRDQTAKAPRLTSDSEVSSEPSSEFLCAFSANRLCPACFFNLYYEIYYTLAHKYG